MQPSSPKTSLNGFCFDGVCSHILKVGCNLISHFLCKGIQTRSILQLIVFTIVSNEENSFFYIYVETECKL